MYICNQSFLHSLHGFITIPAEFAKFSRIPILKKTCRQLLLILAIVDSNIFIVIALTNNLAIIMNNENSEIRVTSCYIKPWYPCKLLFHIWCIMLNCIWRDQDWTVSNNNHNNNILWLFNFVQKIRMDGLTNTAKFIRHFYQEGYPKSGWWHHQDLHQIIFTEIQSCFIVKGNC